MRETIGEILLIHGVLLMTDIERLKDIELSILAEFMGYPVINGKVFFRDKKINWNPKESISDAWELNLQVFKRDYEFQVQYILNLVKIIAKDNYVLPLTKQNAWDEISIMDIMHFLTPEAISNACLKIIKEKK